MNNKIVDLFYEKVEKSYKRMNSLPYRIQNVFQKTNYSWPGDWEGRALLSFMCLYEINGKKISCADEIVKQLNKHINSESYFGKEFDGEILDEQQIAGNSWLLRGLLLYYKNFPQENVKIILDNIVENLYLKGLKHFNRYPIQREKSSIGEVSGNEYLNLEGWKLSTDIGCAFIALDGISEYYKMSKKSSVKYLFEIMAEKFVKIDFLKINMQTHATLSGIRGLLTFYEATGEKKYLIYSRKIFQLYIEHGMTLTYENFNWFNRKDTWTEPCAVVDSLIIALKLYKYFKEDEYLKLARRIYFNGFSFCQRFNGGAGTDTCVTNNHPFLKIASIYEAVFCCSMRYTEGLLYIKNNIDLFDWEPQKVVKDNYGRYFSGDMLLGEIDDVGERITILASPIALFDVDGYHLIPILQINKIPKKLAVKIKQRIIF